MAVIAKISHSASAHASIQYALGKGENKLKNGAKEWLEQDGDDTSQRAVAMGGTNGIRGEIADMQFKAIRQLYGQDEKGNQAVRIIQSFSPDELDRSYYSDWDKANELGVQLAQEMYPDYQAAVYTHLDGKNGVLHNHIIVNKVNLHTGKKMDEKPRESVTRAREINDKIARQQGWHVIEKPKNTVSHVENDLGVKSWRLKIKTWVQGTARLNSVTDWDSFKSEMAKDNIAVVERGKTLTYVLTDDDGKEHRVRANKLGTDFSKEHIENVIAEKGINKDEYNRITEQFEQRKPATSRRERTADAAITTSNGVINSNGQRKSTISKIIGRIREQTTSIRERIKADLGFTKNFINQLIDSKFAEGWENTYTSPAKVEEETIEPVNEKPRVLAEIEKARGKRIGSSKPRTNTNSPKTNTNHRSHGPRM